MTTLEAELPDYLLIGGDRLVTATGGRFEHRYPGDGSVQAVLPRAGAGEVDLAVQAATSGLATWGHWSGTERRHALSRFAALLDRDRDALALVLVRELGFPIAAAGARVDSARAWLDVTGSWADKLYGEVLPSPGHHSYSTVEPLGVVAVIPAWNGSLSSFGMTAGPALAAGCTVVVKPSELAPFGPLRLGELALEAGIPAGVVNVLPGDGATGQALITHPGIAKVAFTGSPQTARSMAASLAPDLRPCVFELGGKSAVVIAEDADLTKAVDKLATVVIGSGQQCTLGSRLLVHRSVRQELLERLVDVLRSVEVGDPMAVTTQMGPVVSESSLQRVLAIIERSRAYAEVVTGGERLAGPLSAGYFIAPTVVAGVSNDSEISRTELFAPVLAVTDYEDDDEAIALANDSEYALAGYVFCEDVDRALRLAAAIDAENVGVNGAFIPLGPGLPFGGRKSSGYGKQGGLAGVMEFVRTRTFSIRLT